MLLPDPPRPPRGLLQGVHVVPRLQERDGREVQQVQPGLHQLRVGDQHIDAAIDLVEDPILASSGIDRST
ncbi:Uncharacterised protein [Acinetobacter baumannii]|nr:Uncharacterised protein [Acinetobacter baumannii]